MHSILNQTDNLPYSMVDYFFEEFLIVMFFYAITYILKKRTSLRVNMVIHLNINKKLGSECVD